MEACCGCGVCEAVCPVQDCVTMVNETQFEDNDSQWEMWRKDKDGYEALAQGEDRGPPRRAPTASVSAGSTKSRFPTC